MNDEPQPATLSLYDRTLRFDIGDTRMEMIAARAQRDEAVAMVQQLTAEVQRLRAELAAAQSEAKS